MIRSTLGTWCADNDACVGFGGEMVNNDNRGNEVEHFLVSQPEQIVNLNCYLKRGLSLHRVQRRCYRV